MDGKTTVPLPLLFRWTRSRPYHRSHIFGGLEVHRTIGSTFSVDRKSTVQSHRRKTASPFPRVPYMAQLIRRKLLRFAILGCVAYLIALLLLCWFEERLIFPIPATLDAHWDPGQLNLEEVTFAASDGTKLHGWYFAHPSPRGYLLYCHGNGDCVPFLGTYAAQLRDRYELSVLVFDYRGYGRSEGSPNEVGLQRDASAAQEWLAERAGVPPNEIILMGRSLGGGVAVWLAAERGAKGLILQNTFDSMVSVAASQMRWLPVRLCMRNRFDSMALVDRYRGPVLQSHGSSDEVVPLELGEKLFAALPGRKEFFLHKGSHNSQEPDAYHERLATFLDSLFTSNPSITSPPN